MIHIIIGTKAQFIKMAPLIHELKQRQVEFVLHDLGQHKGITPEIRKTFGIDDIDCSDVVPATNNASSPWLIIKWTMRVMMVLITRQLTSHKDKAIKSGDMVLVHGDTLSTLYGALLARRLGGQPVLIEAGLTSGRLFNPFPEELIRRLTQALASQCYCPGDTEYNRLKIKYPGKTIINTRYNTVRDAITLIRGQPDSLKNEDGKHYVLCTIHRFETIASRKKVQRMVSYINQLARINPVRFYLHEPTEKYLNRFGLMQELEQNPAIELLPLQPYHRFIQLLEDAVFIVTDGGSIQEECAILGKPCILYRETTERTDGIGSNAALTSYDVDRDLEFVLKDRQKAQQSIDPERSATTVIIDHLLTTG